MNKAAYIGYCGERRPYFGHSFSAPRHSCARTFDPPCL